MIFVLCQNTQSKSNPLSWMAYILLPKLSLYQDLGKSSGIPIFLSESRLGKAWEVVLYVLAESDKVIVVVLAFVEELGKGAHRIYLSGYSLFHHRQLGWRMDRIGVGKVGRTYYHVFTVAPFRHKRRRTMQRSHT